MPLPTIEWEGNINGRIRLIDQTLLPTELKYVYCEDIKSIWHAIKTLMVRGAPVIGIAGAMGVVLGIKNINAKDANTFLKELKQATTYLGSSRPTAVNLFWGLARMERVAQNNKNKSVQEIKEILLQEALKIQNEDKAICRKIGENGTGFIKDGNGVLTHCNAGGLATADYGTALAVMFKAKEQGKQFKVYADETRPLLQGSRLTAWELMQAGIDVTLICDNMAGHVIKSGNDIPIEERSSEEVTCGFGKRTAPEGIKVFNPAFDVTPAKNITAIITEKGIIKNPSVENIQQLLGSV